MSNETILSGISPGALVDFGQQGKLYVVSIFPNKFWVTDVEADRHNPQAPGWYVGKEAAVKVLESGQ